MAISKLPIFFNFEKARYEFVTSSTWYYSLLTKVWKQLIMISSELVGSLGGNSELWGEMPNTPIDRLASFLFTMDAYIYSKVRLSFFSFSDLSYPTLSHTSVKILSTTLSYKFVRLFCIM